jgi:3-methylcrotonyl-CoA carboxylase alpha subunit
MKVLVERGGRERLIVIEPSGAGYLAIFDGQRLTVEGQIGPEMRLLLDGRPIEATARRDGGEIRVELGGRVYAFRARDARAPKLGRRGAGADLTRGELHAPMPGLVIEVLAQVGDEVESGRPLVVVEAMKMQNAFVAPLSGRVTRIDVKPGMPVESGQLLLLVAPGEV